jgi:hypothetical protein
MTTSIIATRLSTLTRRTARTTAGIAAAVVLAGCAGTNSTPTDAPPPSTTTSGDMGGMAGMGGMPGMSMASGNGLADTVNGYTLAVHTPPGVGPTTLSITQNGVPVTAFDPEQTKLMHFYLIRSDLTGFQHVHPTMSPDGTWTAPTTPAGAGDYRIYVQFVPHADAAGGALTVSAPVTVPGPGAATMAALPAPAATTTVDGYTVTLGGNLTAGQEAPLTITVSRNSQPVTDLQPYLDTYAHVTAIHQGDLAFAHLHPEGAVNGDHGGPTLTVHAQLPAPGNYRMFIQFQTGNTLHTAPITITAN